MSNLLNSVIAALGGAQGGTQQGSDANPLIQIALQMLAGGGAQGGAPGAGGLGGLGGLAGLIAAFQQSGLGDQVQSWVGTGQNMPIGAEQLERVLGSDALGDIARQLGLSSGDAAAGLADVLPGLIDQLTPQGQLPAGGLGDVASIMEMLGGRKG
jgi:uncharacterized protein YidB (DUF937 family)